MWGRIGVSIMAAAAMAAVTIPTSSRSEPKGPDPPSFMIDTVRVWATALPPAQPSVSFSRDYVEQLQEEAGAEFINKGSALTRDIYLDGLKRGDITISVDGERLTTACPNRMDVHVTRLSPLDVRQVTASRTGGPVQVGLGGLVLVERQRPGEALGIGAFLSGETGRGEFLDGGLAVEGSGLRGSGRFRAAEAYLDGDGRSFHDLYGYAELPTQRFADITLGAARGRGSAVAVAQIARDQLTPYLQMDERETDFWSLRAAPWLKWLPNVQVIRNSSNDLETVLGIRINMGFQRNWAVRSVYDL